MKDSIRSWLTEQFGADEDLFTELYGQYSADMKSRAAELPPLLSAGEVAAIGEIGHAMKGMALQMGDGEVSELCLALQNAGRGRDLPLCVELEKKISAAVAAL